MENASKALIIAGAILLSILIISLGIMVYNNAKSTVGSANLDAQSLQAFNSQWEGYIGTNKSASDVKAMISAVNASNAAEQKSGRMWLIDVSNTGTPVAKAITQAQVKATYPNNLSNGTYTISVGYDTTGSGRVVGVAYKAN